MSVWNVEDKRIVVTGATNGIGKAAAVELARRGAKVVVVGRSTAKCDEICQEIALLRRHNAESIVCDFASLRSIKASADQLTVRFPKIDVLVNNAGAIFMKRGLTEDGFEQTFGVNHLGYFAFTNLLLPSLRAAHAEARIVNVASRAHYRGSIDFDDLGAERGYTGMSVYSRSKLCNVLFSAELARRLAGTQISSNSVHPGVIGSGFGSNTPGLFNSLFAIARPFMRSEKNGAEPLVYLAGSTEVSGVTGRYFSRLRDQAPSKEARDRAIAEKLWALSEELTGIRFS